MDEAEFLDAVSRRLRRAFARGRSRGAGRDGHRQYHGGRRDRGGAVRRRRRALGRPRHWRRRRGLDAQARGDRRGRSQRHRRCAQRSAARRGRARRTRACRHPRRHARRAASRAFRCCSTASSAPPRWRRSAKLRADALDHALAGHLSAEAGHRLLLQELGLHPLLDLDMRLGEGSGAAVAVLVLRAALACHTGMATFAEAAGLGQGRLDLSVAMAWKNVPVTCPRRPPAAPSGWPWPSASSANGASLPVESQAGIVELVPAQRAPPAFPSGPSARSRASR